LIADMANRVIKWRKQWEIEGDRVVLIIASKFDKCWRRSEDDHLY
jgi:hypothetical protein